jgi:hypothetical protein
VTIVAIPRSTWRLSRYARAPSCRRSSSVRRRRRPPRCGLSTRFSSIRWGIISRSRIQPAGDGQEQHADSRGVDHGVELTSVAYFGILDDGRPRSGTLRALRRLDRAAGSDEYVRAAFASWIWTDAEMEHFVESVRKARALQ